MKKRWKVATAAAVATLLMNFGVAAHADDTPADGPTIPSDASLDEGAIIAWNPAFSKDDWGNLSSTERPSSNIAARAAASSRSIIDTGQIIACAPAAAVNTVIEKMSSKYDGTISHKCGNNAFGFNHILKSHPLQEWRNQMGGDGSVTEWIKYLIRGGLAAPSKKANVIDGKRCYSTPTQVYRLVNGTPKYWKTINASVYVSTNNKHIVSAIPTTTSRC